MQRVLFFLDRGKDIPRASHNRSMWGPKKGVMDAMWGPLSDFVDYLLFSNAIFLIFYCLVDILCCLFIVCVL